MLQYLITQAFFNPGSIDTGCMCPAVLAPAASTQISHWERKRAE